MTERKRTMYECVDRSQESVNQAWGGGFGLCSAEAHKSWKQTVY